MISIIEDFVFGYDYYIDFSSPEDCCVIVIERIDDKRDATCILRLFKRFSHIKSRHPAPKVLAKTMISGYLVYIIMIEQELKNLDDSKLSKLINSRS